MEYPVLEKRKWKEKKASVAGGLLSILTEQKLNKEMFGIQVRLPRRTLEELPRNAGLN